MKLIYKLVFYFVFVVPALLYALFNRLFIRFNNKNRNADFLIIQIGDIGDLICTGPMIRSLKKAYPKSNIDIAVQPKYVSWVSRFNGISSAIACHHIFNEKEKDWEILSLIKNGVFSIKNLRNKKYDFIIETSGHLNRCFYAYFCKSPKKIGFNYMHHGLLLNTKINYRGLKDDTYEVARLLSIIKKIGINNLDNDLKYPVELTGIINHYNTLEKSSKIVGIFPGAAWLPKRWPAHKFNYLIHELEQRGYYILIFFGEHEADLITKLLSGHKISFIISKSLDQMAVYMKGCSLVISNDAGPMHVAVSLKIPTIGLFGPSNIKRWGHPQAINISANPVCSPCALTSNICDNPKGKCMDNIDENKILNLALEVLKV